MWNLENDKLEEFKNLNFTKEEIKMIYESVSELEWNYNSKFENASRFGDEKYAQVCKEKYEILRKIKEKIIPFVEKKKW